MVTELGGLAGFATAGAFFGAGLIFKDDRARDTGYLAASAILQAFLVDNVLKGMTGRQRPFVADGEDHWAGPAAFFKRFEKGGSDLYGSFPSGHSAAAFSLATVVALQYRTSGLGADRGLHARRRRGTVEDDLGPALGLGRGRRRRYRPPRRPAGRPQPRPAASASFPTLACSGRGLSLSVFYDLDRTGR